MQYHVLHTTSVLIFRTYPARYDRLVKLYELSSQRCTYLRYVPRDSHARRRKYRGRKNEKRNGSGYGDTYRFNKPRKPARESATSVVQSARNRASCGPVWDKSDPALEICPTPRELVRTMPYLSVFRELFVTSWKPFRD